MQARATSRTGFDGIYRARRRRPRCASCFACVLREETHGPYYMHGTTTNRNMTPASATGVQPPGLRRPRHTSAHMAEILGDVVGRSTAQLQSSIHHFARWSRCCARSPHLAQSELLNRVGMFCTAEVDLNALWRTAVWAWAFRNGLAVIGFDPQLHRAQLSAAGRHGHVHGLWLVCKVPCAVQLDFGRWGADYMRCMWATAHMHD